jgi:hypothetical protein
MILRILASKYLSFLIIILDLATLTTILREQRTTALTEDSQDLQTLVVVLQNKKILSSRRCLKYQVMSRFLCKLNNTLLVEIAVLVRVVPSQQKVLLLQTPSLVQSLSMLE